MLGFVNEDGSFDKEGLLKAQKYSARIGYRMATIELELHKWNVVNKKYMLTGCSLTGMMDFSNATKMSRNDRNKLFEELRDVATDEAKLLANELGYNESTLNTCIKPSGTISQLCGVSSGVHFSHSPYYIRRVRITATDPLAKVMEESGFKWSPEVGQTVEDHKIKVFEFPIKAPEGKTKYNVSAIEQLELYLDTMRHYTQHNSSNTIHVRENEWDDVEQFVYDNWDEIVGVTFLSLDDSFYQLLPYEAISKEEYEEMVKKTPKMNLSLLSKYETFKDFDLDESDCEGGICPIR